MSDNIFEDEPLNPIAHTASDDGQPHLLVTHLVDVEAKAALAATPWGQGWAGLAGRWHDLGKYSAEFQDYLRRAGEDAAHAADAVPRGRIDHSTAGAIHAAERLGGAGRLLAYAIAGHHAGLADWHGGLEDRLRGKADLVVAARAGGPPPDLLAAAPPPAPPRDTDLSLFVRMIFSALVDADRLDTEAFRDPTQAAQRLTAPSIAALSERLDRHLAALSAAVPDTVVNRHRRALLQACHAASELPPGLFSLTAPTGLGKTLSGLAFALRHAAWHGLRRVIYVAPYTSIIEQTADVFRAALGDTAVLEHHSALDPEDESRASTAHRLAAENWDATVVVTTAVQLFESLYAAHPGRCRKLHRIAGAVLFLDEAQTLPPDFLLPVLHVLQELMARYGTTVVLSTATQPALRPRPDTNPPFPGLTGPSGWREIVSDPAALHSASRRVRVELPEDLDAPLAWEELAERLQAHPSALCIVDRRADTLRLHGLMSEGTIHLSALMCGAHRADVLEDVRARLRAGTPVRVVSTQLVEAGVDLDFPVVFRALAGLDSLAQAAGRCNREGRLAEGVLHVFVPPKPPPKGHLRQAADVARLLLRRQPADPFAPEMFRRFFEQLFWVKGDRLDVQDILKLLPAQPRDLAFAFRTAAERFRLIPDDEATVLVPYGEGAAVIQAFKALPGTPGQRRWLFRRAQRFRVGVPRRLLPELERVRAVEQVDVDVWAASGLAYSEATGFDLTGNIASDALIDTLNL